MEDNLIEKIKRRFFFLFHPIGFIIEVLRYKATGNEFVSKYLITSFCLIGGKLQNLASRYVAFKKVNFDLENNKTILSSTFENETKNLIKLGHCLVPNALPGTIVEEFLELAKSTKGSYREMDSGAGGNFENCFFNREKPLAVRFDYNPNELFKNQLVQDLVCDPAVLNIAQNYLGGLPVFDFVAMWWHTESATPDKHAAQYFHFDMDRIRWIKFFFYLTNVNSDSGPHTFIERSHADGGIPLNLRSKGYARLTDDEVSASFPEKMWKEFVGPRGSMIVEDTRGLHKGKHVLKGDRLLFQIQYTSSLFNKTTPKTQISRLEVGPLLNKTRSNYPEIFQQVEFV